jgi:hypothetical protein
VAATPVINAPLSEIVFELFTIVTGMPIITNSIKIIITVINAEIIRNDQKFFAPFLKNSADENLEESFLRLQNKPPVRNALAMNPTMKTKKNPENTDEIIDFRVGPRSI